MEQLPPRISQWLSKRQLLPAVISDFEIGWNGRSIVIPVHDADKKILFNKYRRDPEVEDGPKYQYDKGGTSQLYGFWKLKQSGVKEVVLCEGELDCLALWSHGIPAVTTTGGSSTFDEDWAELLKDYRVFICYDNDEAGIHGALQAQGHLPHASIVWLGDAFAGKDVTDYFLFLSENGKTATEFMNLCANSQQYKVPLPVKDWPDTKVKLNEMIKADRNNANAMLQMQRDLKQRGLQYRHTELLITYLLNRIEATKRRLKYSGGIHSEHFQNRIQAAKSMPIDKYIEFRANTACCIWHNERTPSMHYYREQNRVKCFGCDKLGDVIDVVMQLQKVDMKEAINIILGNVQIDA